MRIIATMIVLVSLTLPVGGIALGKSVTANAARGKAVYLRDGCQGCHGTVGQGGLGPKLGPDPLPLEALVAFVRGSTGPMPAFSEKVLSDTDLADIHAYLESVPKVPDIRTIPLLNE